MTIYLRYFAPFVMPFVLLGMARLLMAFASMPWDLTPEQARATVFFSMFCGILIGFTIIAFANIFGIKGDKIVIAGSKE